MSWTTSCLRSDSGGWLVPEIWAAEMDVFDFLDEIEDESLDGVLTDLPWPTTERHRNRGTTTRTKKSEKSSNEWYDVMWIPELVRFFGALYPKLKDGAHCFAYCDDPTYLLLAFHMGMIGNLDKLTQPGVANSDAPKDRFGWRWWNPLTWTKTTLDQAKLHEWHDEHGHPEHQIRSKWNDHYVVKIRGGNGYHPGPHCTERILQLQKGTGLLQHRINNAFFAPRPRAQPKGRKAAASPKPLSIAQTIAFAMTGGEELNLCDPFVGCGNHAEAFLRAGANAIVNDRDLIIARDWLPNIYGREINEWSDE